MSEYGTNYWFVFAVKPGAYECVKNVIRFESYGMEKILMEYFNQKLLF